MKRRHVSVARAQATFDSSCAMLRQNLFRAAPGLKEDKQTKNKEHLDGQRSSEFTGPA